MIKTLIEKFTNPAGKLDRILKPIEKDLLLLENNLRENMFSGNSELDKMVAYFFKSGGKRLRPAIIILYSRALNRGYLADENFRIAEAVEMIHTASLVHDDVIDEAETRRGFQTINKKWGSKLAVITGDYILSRALSKLTSVGILAVEIFSQTLNALCIGEIMQKNQSFKVISMEEYINKSERKTAKLFMAGMECAASIMPETNNLVINIARGYSYNFGIAFQIMDDILNFTGDSKKLGKPAGNDLKHGIITAPVIFAVEEYDKTGDSTLKNLILAGLKTEKDFKKAVKLVIDSNGIQKAQVLAQDYSSKAVNCLANLKDSVYKQSLIDLANYSTNRKY
ncbi:MAG TPA: polyprenyl synthetase family protein [Candidatus Gastranaerophilales bacterium]|nr:polyprenyl synthetase family protein [Candidatus Gastranaerophilales bacterium]